MLNCQFLNVSNPELELASEGDGETILWVCKRWMRPAQRHTPISMTGSITGGWMGISSEKDRGSEVQIIAKESTGISASSETYDIDLTRYRT